MKQEQQALTAQSVITYHMKEAKDKGDMKALASHVLVYQAIINRATANT